ncbi:MAG: PAS domain S-box protein, partial [Bacteroidetes bacterium]|nr:PAS domain S-box protein [Bacteroidota bacterium]
YRVIIEDMNGGTATLSPDGTILYCNRRFAEFFKEPTERVIGSTFRRYLSGEDGESLDSLFHRVMQYRSNESMAVKIISEGEALHLHLSVCPTSSSELGDICVTATNISDFKNRERELLELHRQSEARFEEIRSTRVATLNMMQDAVEARNDLELTNRKLLEQVAERKRAEDALALANAYNRSLIEVSLDPLVTISPDGKVTDVNAATETATGWSREELIGTDFSDYFTHPEKAREGYEQAFREGRVVDYPLEIVHKDGRITPVLYNASVYRDEAGKVRGVFAAARDITERRRVEAALKARAYQQAVVSELGQHALSGTSIQVLMDAAVALVARTLNVEYCKILQLQPDGKSLLLRTGVGWKPGYVGKATVPAGYKSQSGYTLSIHEPVIVNDLRTENRFHIAPLLVDHTVISGISVVIGEKDRPYGVLGADSTEKRTFTEDDSVFLQSVANVLAQAIERKRAEDEIRKLNTELEVRVKERTAQLEDANKELEAFSYSVSHDLRAPLRSIDGFSMALLEDYSPQLDSTAKDYLNRLRGASQAMATLIDDLLELSRVTRHEIRTEKIDLNKMAQEIVVSLMQTEPGRAVEIEISPNLDATGDPHLVRIAMHNLIGNAWKFTARKPDARIEIGMVLENGRRVYFIRDNGAGFNSKYADKLFVPFQRLHSPKEFPGTGIGLATAQRIIKRHGGRIWAEGEPEKGATFHFTLQKES